MCKYCEFKQEATAIEGVKDGAFMYEQDHLNVRLLEGQFNGGKVEGGNYLYIDIYDDGEEFTDEAITINFCPMCGRKLQKESMMVSLIKQCEKAQSALDDIQEALGRR